MSLLREIENIKSSTSNQLEVFRKKFNNFKRRDPDGDMIEAFNNVKQQLLDQVKANPNNREFKLKFPKSLFDCVYILDQFKAEGIVNFKLDDEGTCFTKVFVSVSDDETEDIFSLFDDGDYAQESNHVNKLSYREVTLMSPFNGSVFA